MSILLQWLYSKQRYLAITFDIDLSKWLIQEVRGVKILGLGLCSRNNLRKDYRWLTFESIEEALLYIAENNLVAIYSNIKVEGS